jgi:hypothetical protein
LSKDTRLAVAALSIMLLAQFLPVGLAAPATVPSVATSLVLTVAPPKLPSDGGTYSAVVVSLADSTGKPSVAINDTEVFLTAAPAGIVSVPASVTIGTGKEYVIVNVTTTVVSGSAEITASSPGLASPSPVLLTTLGPAGYPSRLKVFVSPGQYLPRTDVGTLRVELVDDAGEPSKAISAVTVLLTSSNSSVAGLSQTSLTIQAGAFYADGNFSTGASPGFAVITAAASSSGFTSGSALVSVSKGGVCGGSCSPTKIQLKMVVPGSPGILPTDGRTYAVLEVSLEDSTGAPAVSPSASLVQLSSSRSEVASTPDLVTIPPNTISTLVPVTTSSLAGIDNVTAFASGLIPTTISIKTVIPAPSKLQVFVSPPASTFASNGNWPLLIVQLQDSAGNPARARQNTNIIITSSNSSLVKTFLSLTIPARSDYVYALVKTDGIGMSVMTAVSPGLSSSNTNLQTVPSPLVVTLTPQFPSSRSYIYTNESMNFVLSATFLGKPLAGANVTWVTPSGTVTPATGLTGSGGAAYATFKPSTYGQDNVTASSSSPQTGSFTTTYSFTVFQVPQKAPLTWAQVLLSYWYFIAAAVAIAIIAVFYLFRMRRKKQRAEIEAGFEVV